MPIDGTIKNNNTLSSRNKTQKHVHVLPLKGLFFCLPPGFLPVVGPTEWWCCLRHLARPCCVALGQALICCWTQNLITFVYTHETRVLPMPCMHSTKLYSPTLLRVPTLYLCLVRDYSLSHNERPFFQLSSLSLAGIQTRDCPLQTTRVKPALDRSATMLVVSHHSCGTQKNKYDYIVIVSQILPNGLCFTIF